MTTSTGSWNTAPVWSSQLSLGHCLIHTSQMTRKTVLSCEDYVALGTLLVQNIISRCCLHQVLFSFFEQCLSFMLIQGHQSPCNLRSGPVVLSFVHTESSHNKHRATAFSTGSEAKLPVTPAWSCWCWLNCCLSSEASSKKYITGHTFQDNLDIIDSDSYSPRWNRNLEDGICSFLLPLLFLLGGWSYAMLMYLQVHDIMLRDCNKQYHFRELTAETEHFSCHWSSFSLRIKYVVSNPDL